MTVYLSLVCPLYNEEENVPLLVPRISTALVNIDYELILVDDGSTDQTLRNMATCALEDDRVKLLSLCRNYGQSAAMKAGIDVARGMYIVTLDGDLQNDPHDIPLLLTRIEQEGWDMIAGRRAHRQDAWFHRKLPSRVANWLIRTTTGVRVHDYGCTLKICKAALAKNLELYGELHRFIPVLAALQGGRIAEIDVNHHPRIRGQSKYGMGRTLKVVSDLLLMLFFQKYWSRSMHLFGTLGVLTLFAGAVVNLYLLVLKFMGASIGGRPLLLLGVMLLIGGLQFLFFGFISEMLFRVYHRWRPVPSYQLKTVDQRVGSSVLHYRQNTPLV